jgi:hypothetical protein
VSTLELVAAIYLLAGLLFVFIGPAAKGLRLELAELAKNPQATRLKVAGFTLAMSPAIVLLWPIFVPSAWKSLQPPTAMEAAVHILTKALEEQDR